MAYPNFSATTFPSVVFPLPDGPIIMIPVDIFTSRFIFFSAHSPQSFQSRYSYHSVSIFLNPDVPVPIPRQGHRIIPIIGNQPDLVADDSFCHFGSSPQTFIDFIFYSVGSVSAVTASPSSFALRRRFAPFRGQKITEHGHQAHGIAEGNAGHGGSAVPQRMQDIRRRDAHGPQDQ